MNVEDAASWMQTSLTTALPLGDEDHALFFFQGLSTLGPTILKMSKLGLLKKSRTSFCDLLRRQSTGRVGSCLVSMGRERWS